MNQLENAPIQSLNQLIDEEFVEKKTVCDCGGPREITDKLSQIMMVDLTLEKAIRKLKISDIPTELTVSGAIYTIKACIEFIPGQKIGHYIAHVLRPNKHWESFDDRLAKVTKTATKSTKAIQVLFYVKK